MHLRRLIAILCVAAGTSGLLFAGSTQAQLNGNDYYNPLYHISFGRPNEAWKFLEIPQPKTVDTTECRPLAAFSNGDGQAIAILAHCPIDIVNSIRNAGDLKDRWPSLAGEIASLVSTGETTRSIEDSTYEVTAEAVRFEIHYRSVSPSDGDMLANWVSGFLVCDTANQQHIFAIRCAAPEAAANAWQSDFSRIMPTLRYDGSRRSDVFVPKSQATLWLFLGITGAIVLFVFLVLRSIKRRAGAKASAKALLNMAATAKKAADLENVPDQMLPLNDMPVGMDQPGWLSSPPVPPERPSRSSRVTPPEPYPSSIPDSIPVASLNEAPNPESPVAVQTEVANGFWKCTCGRINPASYEFCARCNLDRVKK